MEDKQLGSSVTHAERAGDKVLDSEENSMLRYVDAIVYSVLLLAGCSAERATAQGNKAQAHVAVARAAVYEPGHDFTRVFESPVDAGYRLWRGAHAPRGSRPRRPRRSPGAPASF